MYPKKFFYENLQHGRFECCGKYDIPKLKGSRRTDSAEFIGFNFAQSEKCKSDKGLHFFLDDYQFDRVWNDPPRYLNLLKQFDFVLSPDFSLFADFPVSMQIYNHYRKHWLGAFWEQNGIEVIPTISWSTPDSFEWCFDGEPRGSVVAVSNVGCMRNSECRELFLLGFEEMKRVLQPSTVLCYGAELDGTINIVPYCKKLKKMNN